MEIVKCVQKIRDKNNKIVQYIITNKYNKEFIKVTPEQLKYAIYNRQCVCTNLKLTSDGRLIDTKTKNNKAIIKNKEICPSIFGVTVKHIQTPEGPEGPYYKALVYIDDLKQGYWEQDKKGGICDKFNFDTKTLKERLKLYEQRIDSTLSIEKFMIKVLIQAQEYEQFRSYNSDGIDKMVVVEDTYGLESFMIGTNDPFRSKSVINEIIKLKNSITNKGLQCNVKYYTKDTDFIIK